MRQPFLYYKMNLLIHLLIFLLFKTANHYLVSHRCSNKQRGIGTDNNTQQDCKRKATDRAATKNKDTKNNNQRTQ